MRLEGFCGYSGFEEPEHLIQKNITNSSRISIVKGE